MRRIGLLVLLGIVGLLPVGCGTKLSAPSSPSSTTGANFNYPYLYSIGQLGSGGNGTYSSNPSAVAVGFGAIYVTDEYYSAVDKFDMYGNYLGQNVYGYNTDLGGMAMDKDGHLYVANGDNEEIDEFDQNLNWINTFTGGGAFNFPVDVKVDSNLNLYVVDEYNNAVYEVNQSDSVVNTSSGIPSGLAEPYQMALAPNGNFYVTDQDNFRVVGLNSNLVYSGSFDGSSSGTLFSEPNGIVADSDGNLIVSDWSNNTVQKFTTSGAFLKNIGNTADTVYFDTPYFMAIDSSNKLYVTDYYNYTVDVFNRD